MDASRATLAFAALSQPTRLAALRLLIGAGPEGLPAGEVARRLGAVQNTMSTHLAALAEAGLVRRTRQGRVVRCAADVEALRGLVAFLLEECCGGRPELCGPALDLALPRPPASEPEPDP